ncbi:MAG TPA: alkaline phosphatase family protein [Candidatus Dormibacteraeota bacterium]|nr:alkaline phosphatase family protein [Candidatus Dormibacteraeota bacterium]
MPELKGRGLVIVHVDGLGADSLEQALREGDMPFVKSLMADEGYQLHRYRCGIPSTTPFVQAGILYGDNSEIPSFRWWDREEQLLVQFGAGSTFKKVANKYFQGSHPLTEGGAAIAACYPGGAAETFGIAFQDRRYSEQEQGSRSAWRVVLSYLSNPLNLLDLVWHGLDSIAQIVLAFGRDRLSGRIAAGTYAVTDVLEEMFVHHITRHAVTMAMREGFSPIYAGFYAFDETGHAFGPDDRYALRILRRVDDTIRKIARARHGRYELVVLSDHGQIDTIPFGRISTKAFGELVAGWLPGYHIQEMKGKTFGPPEQQSKGRVNITNSGGLSHVYFADRGQRLSYSALTAQFPGLAQNIAALDGVALVMARDGESDVFLTGGQELRDGAVKAELAKFDDPDILHSQLSRLNSFHMSGDLIVFGAFKEGRQVNFENQAGGHGSIGGEQAHPFVLAKREWDVDTSSVQGAHEVHPILSRLRDSLRASG